MMRILLMITGLLLTSQVDAEVYRSVDESGNVIFTDTPSENAEKIEVRGVQTIPNEAPPEDFTYTQERKAEVVSPYTALAITSPENDTAISENAGTVNVSVSLEPKLNTGHKLKLLVDGNPVAEGGSGQFQLSNVDRGTHTLVAVVENAEGTELMRSSPVSFTVQRHSIQHNPSTVGKPKPPPKKP